MPRSKMNKLGLDNSVLRGKNGKLHDDTTECGEFIASFDNWLTLEEQKRNANYLANIDKINRKEMENEKFKG